MDIQKRRTFIISFVYFSIIGVLCYILFKRLIPMLMPFIAALAIAAMLDPAVSLLEARMGRGKEQAAGVVPPFTARWWSRVCPDSFPFWKTAFPDTASISPPLEAVWNMPWKMRRAPFPPA